MKSTKVQILGAVTLHATTTYTDNTSIVGLRPLNRPSPSPSPRYFSVLPCLAYCMVCARTRVHMLQPRTRMRLRGTMRADAGRMRAEGYLCRGLSLGTNELVKCLNEPCEASAIVAEQKSILIDKDFELLTTHGLSHRNAKLVAEVAQTTSWRQLWDIALDRGVKGTLGLQRLLRELG